MTLTVGDKVSVSTRNLKTSRPSKKLDAKCKVPYMVRKIINKNAYKQDLPSSMRNENVIHVSLLDRYTPPVAGQQSPEPHPTIVEENED